MKAVSKQHAVFRMEHSGGRTLRGDDVVGLRLDLWLCYNLINTVIAFARGER